MPSRGFRPSQHGVTKKELVLERFKAQKSTPFGSVLEAPIKVVGEQAGMMVLVRKEVSVVGSAFLPIVGTTNFYQISGC